MASKKMTIGEIEQIKAKATQERAQAAIDLTDLAKRVTALEEEAQAAADGGDLATYREKKAQAEAVKEELFVKQAKATKQESPITEAMTAEAWETYRADYDKKFKAKYAALESARAELLTIYKELFDMQQEAFKTRERLAGYLGMNTTRGFMQLGSRDDVEAKFPCEAIPLEKVQYLKAAGTTVNDPLAIFYFTSGGEKSPGELLGEATQQFNSVILYHRSK